MKLAPLVFASISALLPLLVQAQVPGLTGCGATCVNSLAAKYPSFGCLDSNIACLCANANFHYGMNDCSKALCPATNQDPQIPIDLVKNYCAAIATPTASISSPTSDTSPTLLQGSTLIHPFTTPSAFLDPTAVVSTLTSTASAPTSVALVSAAAVTVTGSDPTRAVAITTLAITSVASPTHSPSLGPIPPSSATSSSPSGLTAPAKIGIGIGATVAGLILLLACFLVWRRRKGLEDIGMNISYPLPGSGRTYADGPPATPEKAYAPGLEMTTRRYEDMSPRQKPRQLV